MGRCLSLVLLAVMASGCGADDPSDPGQTGCEQDPCSLPGLPADMACPPGELELADGGCRPAGLLPEDCAEGFVHDGDRGCTPVLPQQPCPPGTMALMGETSCRPVAPCGSGPWGNIPVDASTHYVDASYSGGDSDGSEAKPWTSIGDAVAAAVDGDSVAVTDGVYLENVVVADKALRIWGRCPSEVVLEGVQADQAAITFMPGADGSELHQLGVRGNAAGVHVERCADVLLSALHVHETAVLGIYGNAPIGTLALRLEDSLVESCGIVGVLLEGAGIDVLRSVLRGTQADASGAFGRALALQVHKDTSSRSVGSLRQSLVEANRDLSVFTSGADVEMEASVVRDTLPRGDGAFGQGVAIQLDVDTWVPSTATIVQSVVVNNRDVGVFGSGSELALDRVVVRDTQPTQAGEFGRCVDVEVYAQASSEGQLSMTRSLVDGCADSGVIMAGARGEIEGTMVRDVVEGNGYGLVAQVHQASGWPSQASLRGVLIERAGVAGVFVAGSQADLDAVLVREVMGLIDGDGSGLNLRSGLEPVPGIATVRRSRFEDIPGFGMVVFEAQLHVETSEIDAVRPSVDGRFGDGVTAVSGRLPASATLLSVHVADSERAGISSFGASIVMQQAWLTCQRIDLNGEPYGGAAFDFDNAGGNRCGCPDASGECQLQTTNFAPPDPLSPTE